MAVAYRQQQPPASPDLIERLEQRIGRPLPTSYRDYLLRQDGGRLADNDEAVDTVFGLGDVPDWASIWDKLDVLKDRVPAWLLPVADDAYGNLFAISLRDEDSGTVWFWDHEEEADEGEPPSENNIEIKARDWQTFLDGLRPLDQAAQDA
jgi:cell wall assembly regulator SMI1